MFDDFGIAGLLFRSRANLPLVLTVSAVLLSVMIHYTALSWLSGFMTCILKRSRLGLALAVLGGIVAHVVEIYLFAFGYWIMLPIETAGKLVGDGLLSFHDCTYFSFVTFTTLGFGDIVPVGPTRAMVGAEALTGLVLVTWTASFLFLQM